MEENQNVNMGNTENNGNKSHGALIGSIIIIAILIIGGIYLMSTKVKEYKNLNDNAETETPALSDGDEIRDIEADLEATGNIDGLDAELE